MRELRRDRGQNYSFLPLELWEKIYKSLLIISGRIRFSSVCKAWLSIASAMPQPPLPLESWLMMFPNSDGGQVPENDTKEFFSLSDKRFYKFDNVIPQDCRILGASNGWVLTERSSPRVPEMKPIFLVNPILNVEIKLPPLYFATTGPGRIKKVLVVFEKISSTTRSESDIPAGVIIVAEDPKWNRTTVVSVRCDTDRLWHYYEQGMRGHDDIVLYNRKLYSVKISRYSRTNLSAYRLDEQLKPQDEKWYPVEGTDSKPRRYVYSQVEAYLVESNGDLLLVKRHFLLPTFEVFKLQIDDHTAWRGVRLRSIGNQAFFVGSIGEERSHIRKRINKI